MSVSQNLDRVRQRLRQAEQRFGRSPDSVALLAVSKTQPAATLREAWQHGQRLFGESYVQEALDKMAALDDCAIEWHFIGPVQSNKTRAIAENFHWVHSIDRLKIARRLSDQRPDSLPPLNVCLQINISAEPQKAGASFDDAQALAVAVSRLPQLTLRGLMAIPAQQTEFTRQRALFNKLHRLFDRLNVAGLQLDTLSMGMSNDLDAAIAEGATIVRIGSAVFGERQK